MMDQNFSLENKNKYKRFNFYFETKINLFKIISAKEKEIAHLTEEINRLTQMNKENSQKLKDLEVFITIIQF